MNKSIFSVIKKFFSKTYVVEQNKKLIIHLLLIGTPFQPTHTKNSILYLRKFLIINQKRQKRIIIKKK